MNCQNIAIHEVKKLVFPDHSAAPFVNHNLSSEYHRKREMSKKNLDKKSNFVGAEHAKQDFSDRFVDTSFGSVV